MERPIGMVEATDTPEAAMRSAVASRSAGGRLARAKAWLRVRRPLSDGVFSTVSSM